MKAIKFVLFVFVFVIVACSAYADDVVRIGVVKFQSRASGVSNRDAEAITDEFTRMLANSYSIAVIERDRLDAIGREHRINMSGLIDTRTAVEIGRIAGLQYIITGAITQLDKNESAQAFLGIAAEAKEEAHVTVDMRVISVQTGEIVLAMAETGSATHSTSAFVLGSLAKGGSKDKGNIQEAAISDAVSKLGYRVKEAIVGEYSHVLSGGGNDIILSVGATSGVRNGNLYKVYADGAQITDMRGNVIGNRTTTIAVVKVAEVQNDFSVAHVVKNGGNASLIRRGDKIAPISSGEANNLAKSKAFPRERPRHHLGESTLEGAELDSRLNDVAEEQGVINNSAPVQTGSISSSSFSSSSSGRNFENYSREPAKVIQSYGLSSGESNTLRIKHINANRLGNTQKAYKAFVEMADSSNVDYLAAFRAGEIAFKIGDKKNALIWFDKALAINPNYEPAQKARERLSSSSSSQSSHKLKTKKNRK